MQTGQTAAVPEMVDAVSEGLQGSLKIAEFDPKMGPSEHFHELEGQLGSDQEEEGDDDEEGEEFEFSFPCGNPSSSPIAAEEAFHNGHIRPTYPLFNQRFISDDDGTDARELATSSSSVHQPLRKFFAEESGTASISKSGVPEAERSPWEGRTVEEIKSPTSWALCRKSNSTGSSKLWRLRDLVHRSSSDGKDAFVFLNPAAALRDGERAGKKKASKGAERSEEKAPAVAKGRGKGKKAAVAAALPPLYGRSRAAEKRRSYLPYRPGLVGFFTSVNGLSKNVHAF